MGSAAPKVITDVKLFTEDSPWPSRHVYFMGTDDGWAEGHAKFHYPNPTPDRKGLGFPSSMLRWECEPVVGQLVVVSKRGMTFVISKATN